MRMAGTKTIEEKFSIQALRTSLEALRLMH